MFSPNLWRIRRFAGAMPEILQLQREMNRLFSSVGQKSPQEYPAINIWKKDGSVTVTAELPGIDPEKIDISVSGDVLTVAGTTAAENAAKDKTYLRQERGVGSFARNIKLPYQVDVKDVEARYDKGILLITLPQLKEDLPQKIKIK